MENGMNKVGGGWGGNQDEDGLGRTEMGRGWG